MTDWGRAAAVLAMIAVVAALLFMEWASRSTSKALDAQCRKTLQLSWMDDQQALEVARQMRSTKGREKYGAQLEENILQPATDPLSGLKAKHSAWLIAALPMLKGPGIMPLQVYKPAGSDAASKLQGIALWKTDAQHGPFAAIHLTTNAPISQYSIETKCGGFAGSLAFGRDRKVEDRRVDEKGQPTKIEIPRFSSNR